MRSQPSESTLRKHQRHLAANEQVIRFQLEARTQYQDAGDKWRAVLNGMCIHCKHWYVADCMIIGAAIVGTTGLPVTEQRCEAFEPLDKYLENGNARTPLRYRKESKKISLRLRRQVAHRYNRKWIRIGKAKARIPAWQKEFNRQVNMRLRAIMIQAEIIGSYYIPRNVLFFDFSISRANEVNAVYLALSAGDKPRNAS